MQNHHLYAMKLSREFHDGSGPPTALTHGAWNTLIRGLPGSQERTREMRQIFTLCRSQALPMRTVQALHRLHLACGPLSARVGGDGRCPICAAQGHNVPETVEHQNTSCPLTTLVTRAWLLEWRTFTGESWTDTLTTKPGEIIPGTMTRWNRTLKRGVCLGLRPGNESGQQDLFTMIRGFAVEAVTSLRNEVLRHKPGDPTPRAADLYHAAAVAYRHITQSLTAALEGDRWRYHLLERQMRGAGLIISQPGPMERWRAMWVQTGICAESATGRLTQNVLRDQPLLGATQHARHLRGTDGAEAGPGTAPGAATNNDSTLRNRRRPTTRNHMCHGGRQWGRRRR